MRLFDTYSKSLVELPAPPGPDPDVLLRADGLRAGARRQRAAVRDRDVARSWLRSRGYEATLVHNITDVNDKIYEAAPGASAELAERATAWYLEDTGDLGLGMPDYLPKVTDHIPGIVRFIEQLVERGFAYPVDGDVYFGSRAFPSTGGSRASGPTRSRSRSRTRSRRTAATSRSGRRTSRARTRRGMRPGGVAGRAGTSSARRWPRSSWARASRSTAAVSTSSSRTTRTSSPSRGRSATRSPRSGRTTGCSSSPGEKMSKSVGNIATLREALDEWGRETLLVFFLGGHWRKPIDFSEETMAQAAAQAEGFREVFRGVSQWAAGGCVAAVCRRPRGRLQHAAGARRPARMGAITSCSKGRSASSVSARSRSRTTRRRRSSRSRSAGSKREPRATFEAADRLRDEIEAAGWEMRDEPGGYTLVRKR